MRPRISMMSIHHRIILGVSRQLDRLSASHLAKASKCVNSITSPSLVTSTVKGRALSSFRNLTSHACADVAECSVRLPES